MKIERMTGRTGKAVANQFRFTDDEGNEFFQSYGSLIAKKHAGCNEVTLDERYWNCSTTTGKYRNQFLGENKAETQRKIDAGIYSLANLN